ncbi:hypothetical protein METP3_00786 [Methanosarcinales archaeon]|nr:hypothetical protein METP3_00786 [Methanosarcinales archaeon]
MEIDLMEPQINADECRFVNLNIQRLSEVYQGNSLIKSPHRSQSTAISASTYEPAPPSREGTRMTRIVRNLRANCMQIARKNYNLTLIVRGYRENKPQINADKRRFVNLDIQHLSEVYQRNSLIKSPQSTQSTQSSAIPATAYEPAPPSRRGTRMTRIARISTDLRASASSVQSAFYCFPSAFYCVHPRLIFCRKRQEALA